MSEFDNSHWTKEEKVAFETWLEISIEIIEKYCSKEKTKVDKPLDESADKAV